MKLRTFRWVMLIATIALCIFAAYVGMISIDELPIAHILFWICVTALVVLDILFWRCPHCRTYLWKTPPFFARYCPYCGQSLFDEEVEWYSDYEHLNYLQGDPIFSENYGEDMILVTYADSMRIHVGYDKEDTMFVITVLTDDSEQAKSHPLAEHRVFGKTQLLTALQNVIHTWRDDKIEYTS